MFDLQYMTIWGPIMLGAVQTGGRHRALLASSLRTSPLIIIGVGLFLGPLLECGKSEAELEQLGALAAVVIDVHSDLQWQDA